MRSAFSRETGDSPSRTQEHLIMLGTRSWKRLVHSGWLRPDGATLSVALGARRFGRITYIYFERRWGLHVKVDAIGDNASALGIPAVLPLNRFRLLRRTSRRIQARIISRCLRRTRHEHRLYWLYDWESIEVAGQLGTGRVLLELHDSPQRVLANCPSRLADIPRHQEAALRKVDLLVAVNAELFEALGDRGRDRRIVVPNCITGEFLTAGAQPWPEHESLEDRLRPRLVVVAGEWSFENCVDHELLAQALTRLNGWTLVLVGVPSRQGPSLAALTRHPRVLALPIQRNLDLAPILLSCDVGAVPYRPPGGGRDIIKTHEYLACGLPAVVTVDSPTGPLAPWIRTAPGVDMFVEACRAAAEAGLERPAALRERLADMTWERRSLKLLEQLDEIAPLTENRG